MEQENNISMTIMMFAGQCDLHISRIKAFFIYKQFSLRNCEYNLQIIENKKRQVTLN